MAASEAGASAPTGPSSSPTTAPSSRRSRSRRPASSWRRGAEALVLCVWQPADVGFVPPSDRHLDADQAAEVEKAAEEVAAQGAALAEGAGFRSESLAVWAAPTWKGIVETAEEHNAGLIVLGSHRRSGLAGRLLGSVAAAVVAHSARSVLVVHQRKPGRAYSGGDEDNAIIFHETGGRPEYCWYPWLGAPARGARLRRRDPPLPRPQRRADRGVPACRAREPRVRRQTVLVGHRAAPRSCSRSWSTSRYPSPRILVAGYATRPNDGEEPVLQEAYDWERIKAHAADLYFVNSVDDPYGCNAAQGRRMLERLGGTQIVRDRGPLRRRRRPVRALRAARPPDPLRRPWRLRHVRVRRPRPPIVTVRSGLRVDAGEGVVQRVVEVPLVERLQEPVARQELVQAAAQLHEHQVDAVLVELAVETLEHVGCSDVDVGDGFALDDDPVRIGAA